MAYLKFLDIEKPVSCTVIPDGNIVTLRFPTGVRPLVNTSGFCLYMDYEMKLDIGGGSYLGYNTVFRNDEVTEAYNGYQLSCDGSIYSRPVPAITFRADVGGKLEGDLVQQAVEYRNLVIPVPVPDENYVFDGWIPEIPESGPIDKSSSFRAVFSYVYVPTLEEIKSTKKQEIEAGYENAKATGVEVSLSTGKERFPLMAEDITFLMGKQFELASSSAEQIGYQDSAKRCGIYSRADMQTIINAALNFMNFQTTYRNNLCEWVDECDSRENVEAIFYGAEIPEQYQNVVYKSYLAQMEA